MGSKLYHVIDMRLLLLLVTSMVLGEYGTLVASEKPRVIATSDGEIDEECSMVRFLLYANE